MSRKVPEHRDGVDDTHLPASAYHAPSGAKRDGLGARRVNRVSPKSHTTEETIATDISTASSQASIASFCTDTSEIEYEHGDGVLDQAGAQFQTLVDHYRVNGYAQLLDLASSVDLRATANRPSRVPARAKHDQMSRLDSGKQRIWECHEEQLASGPHVLKAPLEHKTPSSVASEYHDAEIQAALPEGHQLPYHHSSNAPLHAVAPPDTTKFTAEDTSTTSVEVLLARQAVSVNAPADSESPVADFADQLQDRVQQSFRQVQEAYEEYARYLESEAEWDEGESMEEEPEDMTINEQECSPAPEGSDSVGSGLSTGSSSRRTVTAAQRSRAIDQRHKRTQENDETSEDDDRRDKRLRPLPDDQTGEQWAKFFICPVETCHGRDGGGISQWVVQLHRHGWYVCSECLGPLFEGKHDLDAHKRSQSCVHHCVNADCYGGSAVAGDVPVAGDTAIAGDVRHAITKYCIRRGKHVRRARYEYTCRMLGKEMKPFVQGVQVKHAGVKTRKSDSREEVERNLREALERQVADLQLQVATKDRELASKDRDNEDLRSLIRRMAEELLPHWAIRRTTLQDMGRVRPSLFTPEQLAAFATPMLPFEPDIKLP